MARRRVLCYPAGTRGLRTRGASPGKLPVTPHGCPQGQRVGWQARPAGASLLSGPCLAADAHELLPLSGDGGSSEPGVRAVPDHPPSCPAGP